MYIGKTPTVGNFQVCDAISVVNGQAAYTLQVGGVNVAPESANHMLVSLNGILQKPGSSFTISGSTMTFASNLATGDVIDFVQILGNVLDIGQPSDDTVKTASIQANAVTTAKIADDAVTSAKANFFNADTLAADLGTGLHVKTADSGASANTSSDELVVEGSGTSGISILSGNGSSGVVDFGDDGDNNVGRIIYSHSDNDMTFTTNASEHMRLKSGGFLLIKATTTTLTNSAQVNFHSGSSEYGLRLNSTNTSGTQYHQSFDRNQSQAGYITSNSATTIAFNNASDQRLKENIQNSNSAIQDLKDIQVRQFDWKDEIDTHRDFGFVAQELVNVVPEAVTQGTDELDENGKPVRSWGVDYSHIVPRLVKVCQEQQTKIEELEARITTLENA